MSAESDLWTELMLAADRGDQAAYTRLLERLAPHIRAWTRAGFNRSGAGNEEIEDVVQETLLAIHLKRHTWDRTQPLAPWLRAIARNKLIDALRRSGRRATTPIEDFGETLAAAEDGNVESQHDAAYLLSQLPEKQRQIVSSMTLEGRSAREVGTALGMTEVAVRVTLHRALKRMAEIYRSDGN